MKRISTRNAFVWLLVLLNIALAGYATPITDQGDTSDYLALARSFLGHTPEVNLSHRSPLYSMILAGFMLLLKPAPLYKAVVVFQYALVGFTSWMIYVLFRRMYDAEKPAMLTALLFNFSFATIFFANTLLTEILTVFLVVLSLQVLMNIYEKGKLMHVATLGVAVGLLTLARFNATPLILTYLSLLLLVLYRHKARIREWVFSLGIFLTPYLLVLNAWCLYNLRHHDFYGLFPHSGQGVSRNITVASIRPDDSVSEANKPVLEIFIKARETYLQKAKPQLKGSLANYDKFNILPDLYGGYLIYLNAVPQLRRHFGLADSSGEHELSQNLDGFYEEIVTQNQGFILKFRFISLLSGFRASVGGDLPPAYGNVNLNILPAFLLKFYRLAFFGISLIVFIAFFHYAVKGIYRGWHFDFTRLAMFFIIFSFWGINFVFVTASDANRYKFPAEPFILGLFVYYAAQVVTGVAPWRRSASIQRRQMANR